MTEKKRSKESIRIALRPDMKERFARLAEKKGLTISALGAYIIGDYVVMQENILGPMIDEIKEVVVKRAGEMMSGGLRSPER